MGGMENRGDKRRKPHEFKIKRQGGFKRWKYRTKKLKMEAKAKHPRLCAYQGLH